jgi:hypothetical protein
MFIDANIFTYLLTGHPIHGRNCQQLLEKVENGDLEAFIPQSAVNPQKSQILPIAIHLYLKFIKNIVSVFLTSAFAPNIDNIF